MIMSACALISLCILDQVPTAADHYDGWLMYQHPRSPRMIASGTSLYLYLCNPSNFLSQRQCSQDQAPFQGASVEAAWADDTEHRPHRYH
ncbi:hypothetical protein BD309DRAFT_969701 [Dichomitus squalens]|nr:hypothetical protein BD309DRAFT_969701 [Dichomitus squalens]